MKDNDKTKVQLIAELGTLRQLLEQSGSPETGHTWKEDKLHANTNRYRKIAENSPDVIWTVDMDMHLTFINPSIIQLLGYGIEEAMSLTMEQIFTEDSYTLAMQALREEIAVEGIEQYDPHRTLMLGLELRHKNGSNVPVEVNHRFIRRPDGKPAEIIAIARDITKRKQIEENVKRLAYYDSVTGLPNRELFNDRITMALLNARRNQQMLGIMMLDLDRFKNVNDSRGHHVGDLLLRSVGERLDSILRKSDTIARMGGDEFFILLAGLFKEEDVYQIAEKILESFQKPFIFDNHELDITASIGVAIYPNDGDDIDTILKKADIAMYRAKETGRNNYQHCDTE
jgi:diguanylate cyclase (GGDEF)-like protein/PAS domain S-box-containing protein